MCRLRAFFLIASIALAASPIALTVPAGGAQAQECPNGNCPQK